MAEKPQAGGAALQVVAYGERLTGWFVIAHHSGHMSCAMRPTISTYQLTASGHIRRLMWPHVFSAGMGRLKFYGSCVILLCQEHICQRNSVPQCKAMISVLNKPQIPMNQAESEPEAHCDVEKGGEKEKRTKSRK